MTTVNRIYLATVGASFDANFPTEVPESLFSVIEQKKIRRDAPLGSDVSRMLGTILRIIW